MNAISQKLATKVSERYFNGRQSVEYSGIFKMGDDKLRISIDKDSYGFQSSAVCKVYNPTEKKWNFLTSIPYAQTHIVLKDVYCGRKVDESGEGFRPYEKQAFLKDINQLLHQAAEIIL